MMLKELILLFLVSSSLSIDPSPPVWANQFSEEYLLKMCGSSQVTPSKLWYDYTNNRLRQDSSNSLLNQACRPLGDLNAKCSTICMNQESYLYLPEENLCCKQMGVTCQPIEPDFFSIFSYRGEVTENTQKFYNWTYSPSGYDTYIYLDTQQQRITKRYGLYFNSQTGSCQILDFFTNSYKQGPIDDKIFDLPSNCQQFCKYHQQPSMSKANKFNNFFIKKRVTPIKQETNLLHNE